MFQFYQLTRTQRRHSVFFDLPQTYSRIFFVLPNKGYQLVSNRQEIMHTPQSPDELLKIRGRVVRVKWGRSDQKLIVSVLSHPLHVGANCFIIKQKGCFFCFFVLSLH